ncbi:MAG TPA: glycosyltransferase, partial [Acidimicrobiales bacterium]|nr:glycosyltransferase [Acidimicrobiales bacterium]
LAFVCSLQPSERNHFEVRGRELGIGHQLLLAGYVPDELLVLLYQSAELVVYPSIYEGYGLPVAEAMACDAPVIASSTSSLPELVAPNATFDPCSTEAITKALERGLSDRAFREELIEWARNHRHSWEDVGRAAVGVYERVLSLPETRRWRQHPVVAVVSPLPPARTGVADYTERLVGAFSNVADVDVFVDGDGASGPKPGYLPVHDRLIGGYDERVLALGNSEFHAGALKLLRVNRLDAVVQAHDARLNGLYLHGEARGAVPEGLRAALTGMYPEMKPEIDEAEQPSRVAEQHGLLVAKEVVALAREVLVTSEQAAEMMRADADPADRDKVSVWEYAYPSPVERSSTTVEEGLICSFGLVNPLKAPETLIRAFAETDHGAAQLAFVGPISAELLDELRCLTETLGLSGSTIFTRDIDDDQYRAWLRRASVAVQLRASSNGETSGAVADCLAYGIPVVVTALGPQAGLPDFVPKVDPGVTPADLAKVIDGLLTDPERRAQFARQAREFVAARSFDQAVRWFADRFIK